MVSRLFVDDAVLALLGKTRKEVGKMKLDALCDAILAKGYNIEVGEAKPAAEGKGGLRIVMVNDLQNATESR